MIDMKKLSAEIHQQCVDAGWWDKFPVRHKRAQLATVLVITEFAEAVEGDRKSLADDHLPQYDMRAVELADAAIRLLDLGGGLGAAFETPEVLDMRISGYSFAFKTFPEQIGELIRNLTRWTAGDRLAIIETLVGTFALAKLYDYDLEEIIAAKRAYNETRADHKKENRTKTGGKEY